MRGPTGSSRPKPPEIGGNCATLTLVNALKAHVVNGQIVLDDPAQLDEGAELLVFPVNDDDMSAEDRAELNAKLDEGLRQLEAGETVDGPTFLAELRSRQ